MGDFRSRKRISEDHFRLLSRERIGMFHYGFKGATISWWWYKCNKCLQFQSQIVLDVFHFLLHLMQFTPCSTRANHGPDHRPFTTGTFPYSEHWKPLDGCHSWWCSVTVSQIPISYPSGFPSSEPRSSTATITSEATWRRIIPLSRSAQSRLLCIVPTSRPFHSLAHTRESEVHMYPCTEEQAP